MFGSTLSGRPVQLATQVDQFKYALEYPNFNASGISHLSIFMLPGVTFDPNYTALVYYQTQVPDTPPTDFKLLGALNVNKQSAIFKINPQNIQNTQVTHGMINDMDMDMDSSPTAGNLLIGISIEPNAEATIQLEQLRQSQNVKQLTLNPDSPVPLSPQALDKEQVASLANKIVTNAYNFLGGFVDTSNKVSMSKFDDWWAKFKVKLANDPSFLNNTN